MDKYFEETYDPRLDVAPLQLPTVPKTGLVSDKEYEGWDAMLELIKMRREDKAERKRMERLGLIEKVPKKASKKSSKVEAGTVVGGGSTSGMASSAMISGASLMEIEGCAGVVMLMFVQPAEG